MLTATVLLAFWLTPQGQPTEKCTLSGTVVDSVTGAALNKVEVQAEPIGDRDAFAASTTTDAQGNFTLVDLPAGQYRLKGARNGYLETYYGARGTGEGTRIALEASQEIKGLQIRLRPFGLVAGTIFDADGEPMVGAAVVLFRQRYDGPGQRTITDEAMGVTDDRGQYRIAQLEPGRYYVWAEHSTKNAYGFQVPEDHSVKLEGPHSALLPTLYPGVVDPAGAQTIAVTPGARLMGVDITLVRSPVFRVTVLPSIGAGLTMRGLRLLPAHDFEGLGLTFNTPVKKGSGEFEFYGVPPGAYVLEASAGQQGLECVARIPVAVAGDTSDVRIAVNGAAEVSGGITVSGGEKTRLGGAAIRFIGAHGGDEWAIVNEDNKFAIRLSADHYNVYFDPHKPGVVIKSIRSEDADVYQDGLTISEAGKTALEIVVAREGGQAAGVVVDKDSTPVAGATVVLIAEPRLRSRFDSFHECTTDQYGRYHFENIRPGDYKLFAWDGAEPDAWFDPDFLGRFEEQGERVSIQNGSRETTQLHVIPVDE